jgi:hypothetical protein
MRRFPVIVVGGLVLLTVILAAGPLAAQSRGLKAIRAADMKIHLDFLGAKEFEGRNVPSTAVEIASRYLLEQAKMRGLKPILPDGSYLQYIPVEVTSVSPAKSRLRILTAGGEQVLYFPQSFGVNIRTASEGAFAGRIIFIGTTRDANEKSMEGLDFRGKIAVVLSCPAPGVVRVDTPRTASAAGGPAPFSLTRFLREKGAAGLMTVIPLEREKNLSEKGLGFDISERLRFPSVNTAIPAAPAPAAAIPAPASQLPFTQIEVRHEAAAAILGVSRAELDGYFEAAANNRPVAPKAPDGRMLEAEIYFETRTTACTNVLGWIEGSDPRLKSEYVTITGHQDHNPMREGQVYPGADDNGSGAVAMLELIEALVIERPKRSVIFVWSTAEEKGLIGAYHFVQHCPVPVEKISANLNLDMISRNDPNMIYLVASKVLSTEFDKALRDANDRSVKLKLDDTYELPTHPDRFFMRSDQYPHVRYGIPGVWIFCGTTPDYHQPTDSIERVDYAKMEKVTKFAYVACLDIGNKPAMMKLDVHPEVTTRGPHNMKINWMRPPKPPSRSVSDVGKFWGVSPIILRVFGRS